MPSRKKASSLKSVSNESNDSSWCDLLNSMQSLSMSSASRSRSRAGSVSSSQVLEDFFSDSGSFSDTHLSKREQKLALWQAILVTVGLCESPDGTSCAMPGIKKPKHFPDDLLPLPESLTGCKKLIQANVFINIRNLKASQRKKKKEALRLFSRWVPSFRPIMYASEEQTLSFLTEHSPSEMRRYTILHGRFYHLSLAKEEFLNPLLCNMHLNSRHLEVIYEDAESDDDY